MNVKKYLNYNEIFNKWDIVHTKSVDLFSDFNLIGNSNILDFWKQDKIYLFHATSERKCENILKDKKIYPSGGCLVGGIYTTPIFMENNRMRLHNLGGYYYLKEIPHVDLYKFGLEETKVEGIIFEVDNFQRNIEVSGINYLKFGEIHYYYYLELYIRYLNKNDREQLLAESKRILKDATPILEKTIELYQTKITYEVAFNYLNEFNQIGLYFNLYGYLLFEALTQYIVINQNDSISERYRERNETYSWYAKELIYDCFPLLLQKYNLENIYYDEEVFVKYILDRKIISSFNKEDFCISICTSIVNQLYENCLFGVEDMDINDFITKDSQNNNKLYALIGHIVHRLLKKKRYINFYKLIERKKARDIWNYWDQKNIALVYNSIMCKGEFGIGPLVNKNNVKIYKSTGITEENGLYYIDIDKRLDVEIAQKLLDYTKSFMR